jgi:endonuclease/exonuclease/phosphatase (EEP) superfamily protein YafD
VFAALVAVVLAACVLPRWLPDEDPLGRAGGPAVRVLTANLLAGAADARALVALVEAHRVDLLAVQELTPDAVVALDAAGLAARLPYRVVYSRDGVTGSGIYARHRLRDDGLRENQCGFGQARARVAVPGGDEILVESVHPCAPSSAETTPPWRSGLAGQPPATVDGPVRVLLGDFNATLDHRGLRDLLATGYRDAADVLGTGLTGTWGPYDGDLIPPVTLDRVLADRRVGVRTVAVHSLAGSDHRTVLAELVLPES